MEKKRNKCLCINDDCQEVTELKQTGITIYKYKINVGTVSENPTKSGMDITPGPEKDIYLVINSSSLPDVSKFSEDATNRIPCKRCLYIKTYAQRHLERETNTKLHDIVGICDHCKAKTRALDMRTLCTHAIAKHFFENLRQKKEISIDDIPSDATIPWTYFRESRTNLHKGFKEPIPLPDDDKQSIVKYTSEEFISRFPFVAPAKRYAKNQYFYPKCLSEPETTEYIPGTRIKIAQQEVPFTISDLLLKERREADEITRKSARPGLSILHHRYKNEVRRKDMKEHAETMQKRQREFQGQAPYMKWDRFTRGQDEQKMRTDKERRERRNLFYDQTYDPDRPMFPIRRRIYKTRSFEKYPFRTQEVQRRPSDTLNWRKEKHKFIKIEDMPKKESEIKLEVKPEKKRKSRSTSRTSKHKSRSKSRSVSRIESKHRNTPESEAFATSDVTGTSVKTEEEERILPPPPPPPKIKKKSKKLIVEEEEQQVKKPETAFTQKLKDLPKKKLKKKDKKSKSGLLPSVKDVKEEKEDQIISEKEQLMRTESDLITKAMKGRMKLRDLPRSQANLEKKSEKSDVLLLKRAKKSKSLIPKLKVRKGEVDIKEVEVKVVDVSTETKDFPPPSLLQQHLKNMKKAQKAGNRDPNAVAKAEKELKLHQIIMERDEDSLQFAIPKHKGSLKHDELPPIQQKRVLLKISTSSPDKELENAKLDSFETDSEAELDKEIQLNKDRVATPPEMIKKTSIKEFNLTEYTKETKKYSPVFFETTFTKLPSIDLSDKSSSKEELKKLKPSAIMMDPHNKSIMRYSLSDRSFIDKGWTKLPTEKVLRKMNVYRMRPTHPEYNFFKRNHKKGLMRYDSGEKLAQFKNDDDGIVFYRNGRVALKYYKAEEPNVGQRYVVYSSGNPDKKGCPRPVTVLAMFDHAGNGIVYDDDGKTRLKYNQTEGVVLDPNLVSSKWMWHSLNDPPVLQQVMIETQMTHKDPHIVKLGKTVEDHRNSGYDYDKRMVEIEFQNYVKEKLKKLSLEFKPYQIKMKALQINDEFALKIIDQKTIYLNFQDGSTHIKFNLGMVLDNKEIIDTDIGELGVVGNSLEKFPARTDSIEDLQQILIGTQKKKQKKIERENRVILPLPRTVESADKVEAALSRPLRAGKVPTCLPCKTAHPAKQTCLTACFSH